MRASLTEAREVRGLSVAELAEQLDVRRETVHRWEAKGPLPSAQIISELARILDVPERFFITDPTPPELAPIFYRSQTSVRKPAEVRKARRRLSWLRSLVDSLEPLVEFPDVRLPEWRPVSDPYDLREEDIEQAAEELRKHWDLGNGAIPIVARLLDSAGIVASTDPLGAKAIDAFSHRPRQKRPLVVIARGQLAGPRIQADCAHELGHLILHGWIDSRHLEDTKRYRLIEDQAWRFARCFLLPRGPFAESVSDISLDALLELKPKWHTSVALMLVRCGELNLINEEQLRYLWIRRQDRHWTKQEPLDSVISSETPRLITEAVTAVAEAGGSFAHEWLTSLRYGIHDVATLSGVKPAVLEAAARVAAPQPRLRVIDETARSGS